MPRPAPPASPPTDELPSLDEGDECTEIFGRQASGAIAGLAVTREVPGAGSLDPGDDHTSPTLLAFEVEVSRSLGSSGVLDDHDEVDTRVDTAAVMLGSLRSVSVPEATPTRDLHGAVPALPPEELSSSDEVPEPLPSSEIDLAATRPLPAAPAALLASIEHGSEPAAPASTRGPFAGGPMTLTPLVPPLPSVASLHMTSSGDRPSALPPPRPPMLSPASLLMPGRGSSPPASNAPLGSSPPLTSFGSSSSIRPLGSSPPITSLASSPPAAVKLSSAGMDFDDATLVKTEDELPILLHRRKSTPPAGMPAAVSDRSSTAPAAPPVEAKRRAGLFGRLLSFVLG